MENKNYTTNSILNEVVVVTLSNNVKNFVEYISIANEIGFDLEGMYFREGGLDEKLIELGYDDNVVVFYKLFVDKAEIIFTTVSLCDDDVSKIINMESIRWEDLSRQLDFLIKGEYPLRYNQVQCKLHSSYLENLFCKAKTNNNILDCGDFNFIFDENGYLSAYYVKVKRTRDFDGVKIITLDEISYRYVADKDHEAGIHVYEIRKFLGHEPFELIDYCFDHSSGMVLGFYPIVSKKLAYIIEPYGEQLSDEDIFSFVNEQNRYSDDDRDVKKDIERVLGGQTIRQSFVEDIFKSDSDNNKLVVDRCEFNFQNGILASLKDLSSYSETVMTYFNDVLQKYERESQVYYNGDNDKIIQEINLHAECFFKISGDILRSNETKQKFAYPNYCVNFIAMAAYFTDIDILISQFVNSTHGKYEYVSKEVESGVEVVKIRAYGKVLKFYNGHSQKSEAFSGVKNLSDKQPKEDKSDGGYVYALINPSMDGLVKIGKTSKAPKERAKELSSATGVATPFIVAYYRKFKNYDNAEKALHNYFEAKGVRYNSTREFFEIEINEAIDAISSLPDDSI